MFLKKNILVKVFAMPFLFLVSLFLFLSLIPSISKPVLADIVLTDTVDNSTSTVTFNFSPNANGALALIVYDSTNATITDSGSLGNVSSWSWSFQPLQTTTYHAQVFAYGTTPFSNVVTFVLGGGVNGWVLQTPVVNGSTVTFNFTQSNGNIGIHVLHSPDTGTAAWDSGPIPNGVSTTKWLNAPNGSYSAALVYGTATLSGPFTFQVGGATWNNPASPPPPFNIMDVFQPAKRFGSFGQLASDVLLILVSLAGALAMIFIMISGFKFVTSSGDEKKLASARATLTYAIIGIAVVILAFVIVQILQYFLQSSVPIT